MHRAPAHWPDKNREGAWEAVAQRPSKAALVAAGVPGRYEVCLRTVMCARGATAATPADHCCCCCCGMLVPQDPMLYMDRQGNWHVIWHVYNSTTPCGACSDNTVSGHHFSTNGIDWHASKVQPCKCCVLPTSHSSLCARPISVIIGQCVVSLLQCVVSLLQIPTKYNTRTGL